MKSLGFDKGRALQNRWFKGALFDSATASGHAGTGNPWPGPDTTTITMDWVLSYSRAKRAYDAIFSDEIYKTRAARGFIKKLAEQYLGPSGKGRFGSVRKPFPGLHQEHINFQPVESGYYDVSGPLDDMTAALGRFSLYVLVRGSASLSGTKKCITFWTVGVYAYDRFEFQGDQGLGYWRSSPPDVRELWAPGYTKITNRSYRDWRASQSKGGDFEIFSDVKVTVLPKPVTFRVR